LSLTLILLGALVVVILSLLAWALHSPKEPAGSATFARELEGLGRAHVEFLPQIRQALAPEDDEFLSRAGAHFLRRRLKKERRRVALSYLRALRQEFEKLLRTAAVVAALSPEIGVGQELERFRLAIAFLWKYRMAQLALYAGYAPVPETAALGKFISGLSVRLEAAMMAMGERAAMAAKMLSASDRSRLHLS
jgi:hypothetical protein